MLWVRIAFGNVLLPGLTKKYFPARLGVMTGFYTVIMVISALSSAISYPLAQANIINKNFSLGLSLNIWVIISIFAMILFYILSKNTHIKIKTEEKQKENKSKYIKIQNYIA